MPAFRKIKIRATVETPAVLVPENEVDAALDELSAKLKRFDLAVLSIESAEPPPVPPSDEAADGDVWSVRGQPVD
jgi:hypothetical protein